MAESVGTQGPLYNRALELYQKGDWDKVIDLLIDVEEETDDVRSLLAAARWQVALARAKQRAKKSQKATGDMPAGAAQGLFARVTPALLVGANLLIYGVLIFVILAIWQGKAMPVLSAFATAPPAEHAPPKQVEAAMDSQDWDTATELLNTFLERQPDNAAAQDQLSYAMEQRRIESLFTQAEGYYSRKLWDQALDSFQNLRATDPDHRSDEVTDYICQTYIQILHTRMIEAQGSVEKLLPLRGKLINYAAECNTNEEFSAEQQILELYIAGIEAAQLGNWTEAIDFFTQVRTHRPNYAGGQIARQLYTAYLRQGEYLAGQQKWDQALDNYNKALALGLPDAISATQLRMAVVATLGAPAPTSTPLPTSTPTATAIAATSTPTSPPTTTPVTSTPVTSTPITPTRTRTPSPIPATPTRRVPQYRPVPSLTPSPTPWPTQPPEPPKPPPPQPTATPVPPTSTPAPTRTPLPTNTPEPPATATPQEQVRPPTPTPLPPNQGRPVTPTPQQGSTGAGEHR